MPPDRDWERELAEIDRRLASIPDAPPTGPTEAAPRETAPRETAPRGRARAPVAAPSPPPQPATAAPGAPAAPAPRQGRSLGTPAAAPGRRAWRAQLALLLRLAVGAAVVAALLYWPYPAACGAGLALYLALVAALGLAGVATSTAAWRHRAPFVHVLGLAMLAAAAVLGARQVLPRVGYAVPTAAVPAAWACAAAGPAGPAAGGPLGTPAGVP